MSRVISDYRQAAFTNLATGPLGWLMAVVYSIQWWATLLFALPLPFVTKPSEVVPAIEKMLSTPGPVILDVIVDKDECVFPMVPAGGANVDMILDLPSKAAKEKAAKSQTGF